MAGTELDFQFSTWGSLCVTAVSSKLRHFDYFVIHTDRRRIPVCCKMRDFLSMFPVNRVPRILESGRTELDLKLLT